MRIEQFVDLATARHCVRAFQDRPVPRILLERVLTAAGQAPSTRNGQPWRIEVVSGAALAALVEGLVRALDTGVPRRLEYRNRPPRPDPVAEQRARVAEAGVLAAFVTIPAGRGGEPAGRAHLRRNLRFYGAPVALVAHLPAGSGPGTFLELGCFLQNVLLGLVAGGLGGCPQASVASYPDVVRGHLGLGPDRLVVCTVAVGYPDPTAGVNAFVPPRAGLGEYTSWHDQPRPVAGASRAPSGAVDRGGVTTTCSHRRDRTS